MQQAMIQLSDISFRYYGNSHDSLKNIDVTIHAGEWVAIIGPNGSGKSTLARIMNGLLVPTSGEVRIKNIVLDDQTVWDARQEIGMVFQNPDNQFVGSTVEDDVAFGLENNGIPREEMIQRIEAALTEVGMSRYKLHEPARLSGGQKQRVALASVLALRPNIIILDEATSMLDPKGRREMIQAVQRLKQQYGLTVISITHDLDEANMADRILVMYQGELVEDTVPEELFQKGEALIEMGLDVPFAQKLMAALRERGIDVPNRYMTEEELMQWLLASNLIK